MKHPAIYQPLICILPPNHHFGKMTTVRIEIQEKTYPSHPERSFQLYPVCCVWKFTTSPPRRWNIVKSSSPSLSRLQPLFFKGMGRKEVNVKFILLWLLLVFWLFHTHIFFMCHQPYFIPFSCHPARRKDQGRGVEEPLELENPSIKSNHDNRNLMIFPFNKSKERCIFQQSSYSA